MQVSIETIYHSLYIQGRGELKREIARVLLTGRTMRKPQRHSNKRQPRFSDPTVMISDRPAEVSDRAVPGHWEGDLIIGKAHHCAIGTLVERTTRFCDAGPFTTFP
jgi:IS30 family transposase